MVIPTVTAVNNNGMDFDRMVDILMAGMKLKLKTAQTLNFQQFSNKKKFRSGQNWGGSQSNHEGIDTDSKVWDKVCQFIHNF
jgi:hypothetical protein